ncbi:MAG: hypothetical protein ACREIJ_00285 [Nitrospiraceae bacterium]
MASGIDWVFEQVEEAIILEDDCLPLPTFFRFCDELLERYRHDERVMCISGINLESGLRARPFSYRFSCFNLCWGWASWRRAWRYFDMTLKLWPALRHTSWLPDILEDHKAVEFYKKEFNWAYERAGDLDNWDYQWTFACWAQHGLSILPTTALVTNIGFGEQATHTKLAHDKRAFLPTQEISFPLQHPSYVIRDREADQVLMRQIVVFNQSEEFCGYSWLRQKYRALLTRHPSLKSPRAFIRRVGERCSAAVAGAARKLMASL